MGPGWRKTAHEFNSLDGARALRSALASFQGGGSRSTSSTCRSMPGAPLEFAFLRGRVFTTGIRESRDRHVTPLVGAFTSRGVGGARRHVRQGVASEVCPDFALAEVDGIRAYEGLDGRETNYDLLVKIPLHAGAAVISKSVMGDAAMVPDREAHAQEQGARERVRAR